MNALSTVLHAHCPTIVFLCTRTTLPYVYGHKKSDSSSTRNSVSNVLHFRLWYSTMFLKNTSYILSFLEVNHCQKVGFTGNPGRHDGSIIPPPNVWGRCLWLFTVCQGMYPVHMQKSYFPKMKTTCVFKSKLGSLRSEFSTSTCKWSK